MNYRINTISHGLQKYPTCGDYGNDKKGTWVSVSNLNNETWELAIALHELMEKHLCELSGITMKQIDDFDIAYENQRKKTPKGVAPCGCPIQDEPGMDIHAPYHEQHVFAAGLEKQFIGEAAWIVYDKKVNEL